MSESPAYRRTETNLMGYITDINLLSAEQRRRDEESVSLYVLTQISSNVKG